MSSGFYFVRKRLDLFTCQGNSPSDGSPARGLAARLTLLFRGLLLIAAASPLHAQSPSAVQFLGVPERVFTSGIEFPIGMAVDTSGNVYIAEYSGDAVYKETLQEDGSYVRSTVASGFPYGPVGLAIDSAGNVYIGLDIGGETSSLLKETLQSGGTYVQTFIGTGLEDVYGIAVDAGGNVYATSSSESEVVTKFIPSGSTYTSSVIFTSPGGILAGVALDSSGNLFVAKEYGSAIYKLIPIGNPLTATTYTSATITTSAVSAFDVAVDAAGDLYIADTEGYLRLETPNGGTSYTETVLASGLSGTYGVTISPAGTIYFGVSAAVDDFSPAAVNLGTRAVQTTSAATTLLYTIQSGTVVGGIHVVAQGVVNTQSGSPEFVQASGGTCIVQTYADLTTCSVKVTMTPQYSGLRTGAVEFLDGSGNLLSTVYLYGIGTAPVAGFSPGTASLPSVSGLGSTPLNNAQGPVFDAAGNMFLADTNNNRVVEVAPGGAATVVSTSEITLTAPTGVAIDGAGNLYIADSGNGRVVEVSAQGAASILSTNSIALASNYGVAVDGLGNVYTSDAANNRVLVFPNIGSPYILPTTGVTLGAAYGVAADGAGNVFIADYTNSRIVKVSNGNGTVLGTGALSPALASPNAVAVDGDGNVYVSDSGNNRVVEISAGTTNGLVLNTGSYALDAPNCAADDHLGDLFICDAGNDRIVEVNQAAAGPLTFSVPGATQSVTMLNLGNGPLLFSVPSSGQNPSFGTSNFTLLNAGTTGYCAQLGTTSSSASLTAGSVCALSVEFSPAEGSSGTLTDSLTVTDNNLGAANSTQSIALSGVATPTPAVTLTPAPASPIVYGQAATALGVAVTYTSGTPTGSVSFSDGETSLGSAVTLTAGVGTLAARYYAAGTHSFQASYGGDSNFNPATSAVVAYVVNQAGSTLNGPPGTVLVTAGESGSIPIVVAGRYAGAGIATPTGSVSYTIANSGSTVVASGTATIASGAASISVANNLTSGLYTVALSYAGDANYNAAAVTTVALRIGTLTPAIHWTQPAQIAYGTSLSGILDATAANGSTAVPGSFTYTAAAAGDTAMPVTAATLLAAGSYTLGASFTPSNAAEYSTASATTTLVVGQAASAVQFASGTNPVLLTDPTTLTAAVSSTAGTPTGTVNFLDHGVSIGSASLVNGTATLTVSSLAVGSHELTALYNGAANFSASSSSVLTQTVIDFTATSGGGGNSGGSGASQTVVPGGSATFSLSIVPTSGTSFPTSTVLTLTGMPAGATATVSPTSWKQTSATSWTYPANTALSNVMLTINLPASTARINPQNPFRRSLPPALLSLMLVPFAGRMWRRLRRTSKAMRLLILGACFAAATGLSGCGTSNGFFNQPSNTSTIVETVTSGALSHSTTITLTVE